MLKTIPANSRKFVKDRFFALIALCGVLCGCATMFAPGTDDITFKTEPEGAKIYDGVNLMGTTPLTYSFVRNTFENKVLTVKMEGRKSQKLYLGRTLEETALFNFGFFLTTGGATSWGIDALTGHMIKYSPNSYLIELEKEEDGTSKKEQAYRQRLRFVLINHDSLKKDIATGQGEYLRAYYEIGPSEYVFDDYRSFRDKVSNQSRWLLAVGDPVEFHRELEREFNVIPGSPNGDNLSQP
jgi:hypothetical protein